jgi:trk system potassium uptake protein TrkH
LARHPARTGLVAYAILILAGALILHQRICRAPGAAPIKPIDALFTSTSAVCVTGLTVRSTGGDFNWFGQLVVLALIQLGGIGIITVTTYITLQMGGRQDMHVRALMADTLGARGEPDLRGVIKRVVRFTLAFEFVGAVLLAIAFLFDHPPLDALWHAVFHSISAFCNAGFSLNDDSLVAYRENWLVNLTIMALIISGGIGYPVLIDVSRNWHGPWRDRWARLLLHTKLMLAGTAGLILIGTISLLAIEWDDALYQMNWPDRVLAAAFQSVTCRTAGFNTIEIRSLTNSALFVCILLMMVGAGPCSTAGGFKVSTFSVLLLRAWATIRGGTRVHIARRTLPPAVIDRAITTALLFSVVSIVGLTVFLGIEQSSAVAAGGGDQFLDAMFEVVSALGTVGLSTGLTPDLTFGGKVIIIALMFIGRLGPISVVAALSLAERPEPIAYASEEPLIG